MKSSAKIPNTSSRKGPGHLLPVGESVAMRVISPAERVARWTRRYGLIGLLGLLAVGLVSLGQVERSTRHQDQQIGGEGVRLEAAREVLRRASQVAAEDPERAEVMIRQAIDLLQTLERPPPLLVATALQQLGAVLERRGESESAHWMLEESRRFGLKVEIEGAGEKRQNESGREGESQPAMEALADQASAFSQKN